MTESRPVSLNTKIRRIIVFFGVVALVILFLGTSIFEMTESKRRLASEMKAATGSCTRLIHDYFCQYESELHEVAAKAPRGGDSEVAAYFARRLPLLGPGDIYCLLDAHGRVLYASNTYKNFEGFDFSGVEWVRTGAPISRIHQSIFDHDPVVTFTFELPEGRRLLLDKEILGIIPLVRNVEITGIAKNAILFILSADGTVIYHPDRELTESRFPLGYELQSWGPKDSVGLETYIYQGKKFLCYKEPISLPQGWTLYAAIPYNEVTYRVEKHIVTEFVLMALVLAALLAILHVLIRRNLSAPVQRISGLLASINPLDKDRIPESMAAGTEELQQIVSATNAMLANIQDAHNQLAHREETFRTVTEFASDWSFWIDPEGHLVYVSPACERITGYPPEAFYDDPGLMTSVVHPEERADWQRHLEEPGTKEAHPPLEFRIVTRDGQVRWISHVCRAIHNEAGDFLGMRGSHNDITNEKDAKEALAKEKKLLAVTLRGITDGVVTVDPEGRVVLMSEIAERLTGWPQAQAVGRPVGDILRLVAETGEKAEEDLVPNVLRTGRMAERAEPAVLISRDERRSLVSEGVAPLRNEEGAVAGAVIVFRDVTEKRRLEIEAMKVQKLESLGVLAGGIAHDFNNLLTGIIGNTSLAQLCAPETSECREQLGAIEKAALRARELTTQLLTFAKGGAPVKSLASIPELVTESATFVLRGTAVRCAFEFAPDLWAANVDATQISQVIQNLIINAKEAMPAGGTVEVRGENAEISPSAPLALQPGKYIRIAIHDQGTGISRGQISRIFDPYFTTKPKGSGLGLAICYSIMTRHGGYITADSQPGTGTTFTLYLPAASDTAPAAENEKPSPSEPKPDGSGRVLVMDDEAMIRELAGQLLAYLGFRVDFAGDGREATRLYQKAMEDGHPFDAVLMDLTIPGGMGGKEAVQKILALDPGAKVIVSSGYAQDPVMANYRDYGFCGMLAKPYRIQDLRATLRRLLPEPSGRMRT